MRSSIASSRVSHVAGLASKVPNPAAALKLLEKKKEFDAVSALEKATALYLERIEGLGEDCDIMANAAQGKSPYNFQDGSLYFFCNQFMGRSLSSGRKCLKY